MSISISSMTVESWVNGVLKSGKDRNGYGYWGPYRDQLGESWGFVFSKADANNSLLDDSNFEVLTNRLESEFGNDENDQFIVAGFGGWMGHIDQLMIRLLDDNEEITPIALYVYDVLCQLDDYPILDEEHFSNLESESDYQGNIESIQDAMRGYELLDSPLTNEQLAEVIRSWIAANDSESLDHVSEGYSGGGGWFETNDPCILAALYALNLIDFEAYDTNELLDIESRLIDYAYADISQAFYSWKIQL